MLLQLYQFRQILHQYPELSGQEQQTVQRIIEFIKPYQPTQIIEKIGGHGVAVVYEFGKTGTTVAIRCELDALPIQEPNDIAYCSKNDNIAHKCGHDGHMTIVAGLSYWLAQQNFQDGKVVLLFQPAEETGKGGWAVLQDERFQALNIDYIFALHNLPGYPLHQIISKPYAFSAAVNSMIIKLKGIKTHASTPEKGINPALAVAQILQQFHALNQPDIHSNEFALITPIHISLGEKAYGISPDNAELHFTLRTWTEENRQKLEGNLIQITQAIATQFHLNYTIKWLEYFPATYNDPSCYNLIKKVVNTQQFTFQEKATPLRFGEDFGWLSQRYKGAMFGLGAGEQCKALHHPEYDFPDELIVTGMKLFRGLICELLIE